jgi:antirestriction protein ArdC
MVPFCFAVFNAAQVDGWMAPALPEPNAAERETIAESFFDAVKAEISYGGNVAAYAPSADRILLPHFEQFRTPLDFYATAAHEFAHWTGHSTRLARDLTGRFGSDSYAAEELVAEISAAFTCAHLGIATTPRPDHGAYLKSWLRILRADTSAIFHAASRAQAATDYLIELAAAKEVAA